MSGVGVSAAGQRAFERFLAPGEEFVFTTRRHWATLTEPLVTAVVSLPVVAALMWWLQDAMGEHVVLVALIWVALLVRLGYHLEEWRISWFGATGNRLLLRTGLLTQKVAMMPMTKVTDMSYQQTWAGQVLRFGTFVLESAGQDQALRVISFVPHSDETYRLLCATMFGPGDPRARGAHDDERADDERADDERAERRGPAEPMPPSFPPQPRPGPGDGPDDRATQWYGVGAPPEPPTQLVDPVADHYPPPRYRP